VSITALEKAEQVEKAAEDLYRRLAAKFHGNPRLRELFDELAEEENQHAERIAMLRYQAEGDPRLAARLMLDEARLDELLRDAETAARLIVQSSLTIEEALNLAYELERAFAVAHAEAATSSGDQWLTSFFSELALDDKRHRELLRSWRDGMPPSVVQ
jgi:rubrerythrin